MRAAMIPRIPMLCAMALSWSCGDDNAAGDTGTSSGSAGTASAGPLDTAPPDTGGDATDAGDAADATEDGDSDTTSTSAATTGTPDTGASEDTGDTGTPIGSDGCGMASGDATNTWVAKTIDVGEMTREYWVWLPEPYDPERAYRVVYQFHGCSDGATPQTNNPPVQDQSGADAIHIRGRAVGSCWDTASEGPDVAFFDAMVAEVEATYCADPELRFATGYSSGAFMTHRLACDRGDVLRGVASIAGGQGGNDCAGQVGALLIHDLDDPTVNISASIAARDALLARNGCDAAAPTTAFDPAPCEAYAGCDDDYPVVWCQTAGQGHSRQDGLSAPAFWTLLGAL